MSDKHKDERFNESLVRCRDKVLTAWACASLLRPDLSPAGKAKLAKEILKMAESKDQDAKQPTGRQRILNTEQLSAPSPQLPVCPLFGNDFIPNS